MQAVGGINEALKVAIQAHGEQKDKAGEPYLLHPIRVMMRVHPEFRVPALLHDVVEDGGITLEEIGLMFGEDVRRIIDALTKREGEEYSDYINRLAENEPARWVKLADLEDNSSPLRVAAAAANGNDMSALIRRYADAKAFLYTRCREALLQTTQAVLA